jgi:tetratricopeptide (TPR) repeat protein
MSRGAIVRKRTAAFIALGAVLMSCGPTVVSRPPLDKKKDTLPDDVEVLLAFAESKTFEDSQLKDLSDAADAYDKAISLSPTHKSSLSKPEMSWRLARVCFFAAEQEKGDADKLIWIARGEQAASEAVHGLPKRVEGYYYLGVLKGRRAQYSGIGFSAMLLARNVEDLGLKAAKLDPTFENGGPYRLLAMLYAKAPPWPTSIGDIDEAIDFANKAVGVSEYPMNHLVRGEVLIEADEPEAAKAELKMVLAAPKDGRWAHEGELWRPYARQLLDRLESGE